MPPLIACVPNFSEARRPDVVQVIVEAIQAVPGVSVLHVSPDLDHNRTVVTFVGDASAVEAGAFAGIARAAERIDMEQHRGAHPRIGATDVVPFVPLRHATLDDCAALARRLGERVGRELGLPVYLYEAAATRPERHQLENIRRGEYEGLRSAIATDAVRQPDFGPARLGQAGATVIGARAFLVAYNIYLNSAEITVARNIARAIRHSSGGLRYVKALGLLVGGQAQVSMNLTDVHQTPVHRVVEMVRREAARYGASIQRCEVVGLIPQAALVETARWYLQLDGLHDEQILEHRLALLEHTPASNATTPTWLEALAAGTATPGGGAAAAYAGAMAAALVAMVARLTVTKKQYHEVAAEMQATITRADTLRAALTASVSADSSAFAAVLQAMKMPHHTPDSAAARRTALEHALHGAAAVPLQVARDAMHVLHMAALIAEKGNVNALSDAGTAASLALAAVQGAVLNVRTNATAVHDRGLAQQWLAESLALEQRALDTAATVTHLVSSRMPSAPEQPEE